MGGEQKPCRKEGLVICDCLEALVSPASSLLIHGKWEEDGQSHDRLGLLLDTGILKTPEGHLNHQATAERGECFHDCLYNKMTFTDDRGRRGPREKGQTRVKAWVCVLVERRP